MGSPQEEVAHKLKDDDVEVRLSALESLTGFQDEQSLGFLFDALGDSEWRVRKTAVGMLLDIEDKNRVIHGLINRLGREKNIAIRNTTVEVFVALGKIAVEPLLSLLDRVDGDIKKFIIDSLGEIKDPKAIPSLIASLSEPNENVQASAIEALGKIKEPVAVDALLQALERENPLLVFSAIKALEQIGDIRAVEPLVEILNKNIFKRPGLEALGAIGDMRVLDILTSALVSGPKNVKHSALKALVALESKQTIADRLVIQGRIREIYNEEIYSFVMSVLNDPDESLKSAAIKALGWLSETKGIPTLISLLNSEYREEAVRSLVSMGHEAVEPLVLDLSRPDEKIRETIGLILGRIGNLRAIPALVELLKDRNGHVRQAAAIALGQMKDPDTIEALFPLLAEDYPDVQEAALKALIGMKENLPWSTLIESLREDSPHLRCNAALLLGEKKNKEAIPSLAFLLKDPDESVRGAAVKALGFFDTPEIFQYLLLALGDEDFKVRLASLKTMEQKSIQGNNEIVDYVTPLLHDENIWIRSTVPRLLACVRGERALKLLLELLNDEVGVVKISALCALGEFKDQSVLPFIVEQTASPDTEVKKAAIVALGILNGPLSAPLVRTFLTDPDWTIRASAARASGDLHDGGSLTKLKEMAVSDPDKLVREAARFAVTKIETESGSLSSGSE